MSGAALDRINASKRIVIKIGSVLVADSESGMVKQDWVNAFADDICALIGQGKKIVIVSSGGVALGRRTIGIPAGTPPQNSARDETGFFSRWAVPSLQ